MTELCEVVITAPDPEWLKDFSRKLDHTVFETLPGPTVKVTITRSAPTRTVTVTASPSPSPRPGSPRRRHHRLSLLEARQAVRATRSAMKEPAMSPVSSAARVITA